MPSATHQSHRPFFWCSYIWGRAGNHWPADTDSKAGSRVEHVNGTGTRSHACCLSAAGTYGRQRCRGQSTRTCAYCRRRQRRTCQALSVSGPLHACGVGRVMRPNTWTQARLLFCFLGGLRTVSLHQAGRGPRVLRRKSRNNDTCCLLEIATEFATSGFVLSNAAACWQRKKQSRSQCGLHARTNEVANARADGRVSGARRKQGH